MKHPIVLFVPVLMLCDYFLTIAGYILRERSYGKHFKTEQYELNPYFQSDVNNKKWFNIRHLIWVIIGTLGFIFFIQLPENFVSTGGKMYLLGMFIVTYSMVTARHLSNILLFLYSIKHPGELSGEVHMSYRFGLRLSQCNFLTYLFPLLIVAVYIRHPFLTGGLVGIVILWLVHSVWLGIDKRRISRLSQQEKDEA